MINEGKEVVVLMHSYGGIVGTDAIYNLSVTERAMHGMPGGVKRLIYMCAFIPQKGQSLAGIFGGMLPPWIADDVSRAALSTGRMASDF